MDNLGKNFDEINPFAEDGIKNLNINEINDILKSNNLLKSIILKVNFDPNKPQHHNIYYADTKSAYGEVYENKKWTKKNINEIINILIDAKHEDLNEILDSMINIIKTKTINKIIETIEKSDCSKTDARKKLVAYLKPILYNNKDIVARTRKKMDNDDNDDIEPIKKLPKKKTIVYFTDSDSENDS